MKHSFTPFLLCLLSLSVLLTACEKDAAEKLKVHRGDEVTMGNGKAKSFFTLSENGTPQAIGFEMTPNALTGLTTDPTNFAAATFVLLPPRQSQRTDTVRPPGHQLEPAGTRPCRHV